MLESADEIAVIFLSDKNILTRVKQKKKHFEIYEFNKG